MFLEMDKSEVLDALCSRVEFWTGKDGDDVRSSLFEQYYSDMLDDMSDDERLPDIRQIVDNDIVNNFNVFTDEEFEDEFKDDNPEEARDKIRAEYTAPDGTHYNLVEAW